MSVVGAVPQSASSATAGAGLRPAAEVYADLVSLREQVAEQGRVQYAEWAPLLERRAYRESALNLAHYLALRRFDLRALQQELMPFGLSSLGRCEARVLPNLDAVISALSSIARSEGPRAAQPSPDDFFRGHQLLVRNTEAVLGPTPANRNVRIMVTLPAEAATDYRVVRDLIERGMDVARINCSHDDEEVWHALSGHVRRAARETGRPCRVHMDLGGPRARTGGVWSETDATRLVQGAEVLLTPGPPQPGAVPAVQVECTLPEVVPQLGVGQAVRIDEGRVGLVVVSTGPRGALLRVVDSAAEPPRLRPGKALNFPGVNISVNPLTTRDLRDLDIVVREADSVGYSFVQKPEDITELQEELAARMDRIDRLALVAKIETQQAIEALPSLIVHGAGRQPFGVMIARGDLAVEIGFDRLAEIQEELLWLCEAAHVPVVWATSVLDTFVRRGVHSRAEMTDAAMAERAECVMLNKGPFAAEAVSTLDLVLSRMEGHQFKKTSRLRALRSW